MKNKQNGFDMEILMFQKVLYPLAQDGSPAKILSQVFKTLLIHKLLAFSPYLPIFSHSMTTSSFYYSLLHFPQSNGLINSYGLEFMGWVIPVLEIYVSYS